MMGRALAIAIAFGLGWIVYMIGMVLTVYDGCVSLILQPFLAALTSAVFVGAALLVGLVLRIPPLSRWWNSTWLWAVLLAAASLFLLTFGYFLGVTYLGTDPETGSQMVMLHPAAAIGGYFFALFAVANWPVAGTRRLRG